MTVGKPKILIPQGKGLSLKKVLPNEWERTTCGTVMSWGNAEKTSSWDVDSTTWVLELEDIEKNSSKLLKKVTFADRQFKSSKNRFQAGNVLYGKLRPYLNKVLVASSGGVCSTEILPLDGGDNVENQYIFYWLKSSEFSDYVRRVGYGVNMPRLGKKDGIAAPFILPPLAEQREIVARVDEQLAQVESLKKRLDAIPKLLKRFHQSTLTAAVSGKLTEEWRANFKRRNDWASIPVDELCLSLFDGPFGSKLKTADYRDRGVRVARLENIGHLRFHEEKRRFVSENKAQELSKNILKSGDILFSSFISEEIRVCLLPDLSDTFINKADCFCLRIDPDVGVPSFVAYSLASKKTYERIKEQTHGATRPRINLRYLRSFEIDVPSLEEQCEIVRRVDELFVFSEQIGARLSEARERVNGLQQSILSKAFSGEMTADWREANPELVVGENSAESLLMQIEAHKKALPKTQRRKPSRKRSSIDGDKKNMKTLVEVLRTQNRWISAQQAFNLAGIVDGSKTDEIEVLYNELRNNLDLIEMERREQEDWLRVDHKA